MQTETTITLTFNEWHQRWMDTPFRGAIGAEALKLPPGTCCKTSDRETKKLIGDHSPMPLCGRIHKNAPDECVVIGHGDAGDERHFVWTGPKDEFDRIWRCD